MACISTEPNGCRAIEFVMGDRRPRIRLGKITMKQANSILAKVEDLISAARGAGVVQDETSRWLTTIDAKLHKRLAKAGLVQTRERSTTTLKAFLDEYFAALSVKGGTATAYGHTRRCLIEFFGEGRALRTIAPTDAEKFRQWLKEPAKLLAAEVEQKNPEPTIGDKKRKRRSLSDSTIGRRVSLARQFFKRAGKWKLIGDNPFADVAAGSQINKARMFFITRDVAQKILDACPSAQWKVIFALSRFGGLRCPSEHMALKWSDITFSTNNPKKMGRMRVTSPKTEHHTGMGERIIPLFPELEKLLIDAQTEAEPGIEHVITKRDTTMNLRTNMLRIIRKAGLVPWPKLFHNLRSSRQTELSANHPIHVVCAWLGNSRQVAQDHYLQVTDSDFEKAGQIPAHSASITSNQEQSAVIKTVENTQENAVFVGNSDDSHGRDRIRTCEGRAIRFTV